MSSRDYAIQHHWGQRYGDKPYYYHLDEVVNIIKHFEIRYDKQLLIDVAYLHDIIEDTLVTYEMVRSSFGVEVANAVYALTNSEVDLREKLLCNHTAMKVKLIDRYCNVRNSLADKKESLVRKYQSQSDLFLEGDFTDAPFKLKFEELSSMLRKPRWFTS